MHCYATPTTPLDGQLFDNLGCVDAEAFLDWYSRTIRETATSSAEQWQEHRSEAAAAAARDWLAKVAQRFPSPRRRIEYVPEEASSDSELAEGSGTYVLRMGTRLREGLLGAIE